MNDSPSSLTEAQAKAIKYCDRCARRSPAFILDNLTLQELSQECCDWLKRQRGMASRSAKPKVLDGPLRAVVDLRRYLTQHGTKPATESLPKTLLER